MNPAHTAEFRFYAQLNDFLPPGRRQHTLVYRFNGHPGIKDPIEVFGVPHTEVELITVNGQAVDFAYQLQTGDRVAVYPVFATLDLTPSIQLRATLAEPRFVLDVNLGKLAKLLRMLGFNCLYRNDYHDPEIADIAAMEQRVVLTRDRRLLFAKRIEHGYWVRSVAVERQVDEVLLRYALHGKIKPFARCLRCNGALVPVAKADVLDRLEPKTKRYYQTFYRCDDCWQIYWQGSHIEHMLRRFPALLTATGHLVSKQTPKS